MLEVKNLELALNGKAILNNVNFEMPHGEILSIIGKSGCGKTSLLKSIAGIHKSVQGEIFLGTKNIDKMPINERKVTLVFQEYSLFPHMTLEKNLQVATDNQKLIDYVINNMELSHLYGKYPHQMSGGEQQRCSMARAIIYQPELLMLDEPFSNVDALTTKSLRKSVHKLLKEFGITTLIVTHDLEDVYEMSQRCMVIEEGTVTQIDTLDNLKTNSNTPFIQQLFSEISVINGKIYKQIL